jgi:hypothetical protein
VETQGFHTGTSDINYRPRLLRAWLWRDIQSHQQCLYSTAIRGVEERFVHSGQLRGARHAGRRRNSDIRIG